MDLLGNKATAGPSHSLDMTHREKRRIGTTKEGMTRLVSAIGRTQQCSGPFV
jgi:hypothetical protein